MSNFQKNGVTDTTEQLVEQVMNFDPSSVVKQERTEETKKDYGKYVYKPSPQLSKAEDGIYRSKIRVIYNPLDFKNSIVNQTSYYLASADGNRVITSSLSIGDKNCPIFKAWGKLWFSETIPNNKDLAKKIFNQTQSRWVLIQVLEDDNNPELVGKFRFMKLAKTIWEKLDNIVNPSSSSKKAPYPAMDYLIGLTLELVVKPGTEDPKAPERKFRETSYELSTFTEYAPIIKTDGTSLLTDAEIELLDEYVQAINESQTGKTENKRKEASEKLTKLKPQIVPLYTKALNYLKEACVYEDNSKPMDLVAEYSYKPWDDEITTFVNRFCEIAEAGINPKSITYQNFVNKTQKVPDVRIKNMTNDVDDALDPITQEQMDIEMPF